MLKNQGNTTIIFLVIATIIFLPAFFNKSTTSREILNTEEETNQDNQTKTLETEIKEQPTPIKKIEPTEPKPKEVVIDSNKSPYTGKIKLNYVYGTSNKAKDEKISIINRSEESINITGFSIETYSLEKFIIPKAHNLPGFSVYPVDDIILAPSGELVIYIGTQERKINFRENICTGYFDEKSDFNGALSHRCPIIDTSKMLHFTDTCIKTLNNMSKCKMYISNMSLDYKCDEFASTHYSYVGCVSDYKNNKNFYLNKWLVWMQRTTEFFRNEHEIIKIKDGDGKIVDEYQY